MVAKVTLVGLVLVLLFLAVFGLLEGFLAGLIAIGGSAALYEVLRRRQVKKQFADIEEEPEEDFVLAVKGVFPDASSNDALAARSMLADSVGVSPSRIASQMTIAELYLRTRTWPKGFDVADPVTDLIEDWEACDAHDVGQAEFGNVAHLVASVLANSSS